jgi:phage virion morphogenesis protein
MVSVSVEIQGDKEFFAKLDRLIAKASDLSPVMQETGEYMLLQLREGFESESDPYGAAWAPLAASTLRQKKGTSILNDTGTMMGTLAYVAGGNQVEAGVNTFYAKYHQFGTVKMPQRKIVPDEGAPPEWEGEIEDIFKDYFEDGS